MMRAAAGIKRIEHMAFDMIITPEAEEQLDALSAREQRLVETAIQASLAHQPTNPSKAIKKLRANPCAAYELRVGDLRVLYNVEGNEVILILVGRKAGNKLLVKGVEYHGHQDNRLEPPGEGREGDAQ
jgi:mRNA-degrading endonuclease RelE of RelBE toxin-antitoxin system